MTTEHDWLQSRSELVGRIHPGLKYSEILSLSNHWKRLHETQPTLASFPQPLKTRLALVGSYTLNFLQAPIELHLTPHNIRAEFFLGEFGSYVSEIMNGSDLYDFGPNCVILCLDHRAINTWPAPGHRREEVHHLAEKQVAEWEALWARIRSRSPAAIIQTNLALPCERDLGNYSAKSTWSVPSYLRLLNQLLAERVPPWVSICDAEFLSGMVGKREWFNEPNWYNARQGVGFAGVSVFTHSLAAMVGALAGRTRKCLVLDLDNTLWGGVVGDVGVEGLRLARGDAVGEAYLDFQAYCKRLRERGILLAVCSKNNPELALEPFTRHPDIVLKREDFSAFAANWNDKVTNLRQIASDLQLGLDSFVFVDDNPAERALMRQFLPEVSVPELPTDPALYRRTLDQYLYFEPAAVSEEDLARANYYQVEKRREQAALSAGDQAAFLASLEQLCSDGPFDDMNLQRITQLINKTNQWNPTTIRLTEGEVRQRASDPTYFTLWVRHRDRFGDSGLISAVVAHQEDDALTVEIWVMSCRVFGRGIEDYVFNALVAEARRRDVGWLEGIYRPTTKNGKVANLYGELGFERVQASDEETRWRLAVADAELRSPPIKTTTEVAT